MGSIAESSGSGSCSIPQYLKQTCAIIDDTVHKNVNKQVASLKVQQDRRLQQFKDSQDELRRRAEEREALAKEVMRKNQTILEKQKELDQEEEKLALAFDAKMKEGQKLYGELKASGCSAFEYVSCFGSFVTHSFKLDWKGQNLGRVKCPEGKTIVSDSAADEEECDFWNCPPFQLQSAPDKPLTPTNAMIT